MDSVVHFEITAANVKRSKKFYETVFGWKSQEYPEMDYVIVMTTPGDPKKMNMPKKPGAINGGMMKRSGKIKSPVITIAVDDVSESLKKVVKAGGKVVMPRMKVGDMGFSAYFKDSEGNVLGLWQSTSM